MKWVTSITKRAGSSWFSIALLASSSLWANAAPLLPGQTVAVNSVRLAEHPELAGTILQDRNEPLFIDFGSGRQMVGTVQVRVVREELDGTLDFYYQLHWTTDNSPAHCCIELVVGRGFAETFTEVGVRTDSLGNTSPVRASRSADGAEISFEFSLEPAPAAESRFLFVRTGARSFKKDSTGRITLASLAEGSFPVP